MLTMMVSILKLRNLCYMFPIKCSQLKFQSSSSKRIDHKVKVVEAEEKVESKRNRKKVEQQQWKCIGNCCWLIGYLVTTWWLLVFLYQFLPGLLQSPAELMPGERLRRDEGLNAVHPMVLVPGIVTGGLELWEGRPCADGLFRKRLWGGSFAQLFKSPRCWLEHLSLDNETGLDPPGIRVRAVPGLVAADYFAPGYFVWAVLIHNLAKIGYEEKNMYMAAYDWRLSFQNTEIRDRTLSRLKSKIELMYVTNGYKKVVVVPHSMGAIYFLHFLKWVEASPPMGGGGGPGWCAKHIKSIMNIAPTFLGVPKTVGNILSAETKDIAFLRSVAPGVFDSDLLGLQTLERMLRVGRTWDSFISLFPKGGETIWGNLDWSPEEEEQVCNLMKTTSSKSTQLGDMSRAKNITDTRDSTKVKEEGSKYGRIVSFGKVAAQLSSFLLPTHEDFLPKSKSTPKSNISCGNIWTEYDELSRETIVSVAQNKTYTANTFLDLFRLLAPKMMQRAEAHISHGIAEDLDDPKYAHYKYWSNPLETKLPDAPDMEIYCLYGVGIPTERSYIYKLSNLDKCNSIPYRIDSSADGSHDHDGGCLKNGVYFVDGDDSVPVISAGFMCAKGWGGKTRFNPSGMGTYIREYKHKAPTSLLQGRGIESGNHVDIMGNAALIEDILRVAAGATGQELGRDRIYSGIMKMSDKIKLIL